MMSKRKWKKKKNRFTNNCLRNKMAAAEKLLKSLSDSKPEYIDNQYRLAACHEPTIGKKRMSTSIHRSILYLLLFSSFSVTEGHW